MSPFERHEISHLSASSCNLFAAQPALWVVEKVLKRKAPVGAAAHRGSAVEAGVAKGLLNPESTVDECVAEAESVYRQRTALCGDPKRDSEGKAIGDLVRTAINELAAYGPGVQCQEKIEWRDPYISVPFVGYADFRWPDHGILIDLKTQHRLASEIKTPHARQVALYAGKFGDNIDARITYCTPKKVATYGLENVRAHLACLMTIGRTIERFLSVSNDPLELAGLLVPDIDSFYWAEPLARQAAWQIWGI
jgi:hypothetical protein